jgi:hypothetical protein
VLARPDINDAIKLSCSYGSEIEWVQKIASSRFVAECIIIKGLLARLGNPHAFIFIAIKIMTVYARTKPTLPAEIMAASQSLTTRGKKSSTCIKEGIISQRQKKN